MIVYNSLLPFRGFVCINLCGILFVKSRYRGQVDEVLLNHEAIHTTQMKELTPLLFYPLYLMEWLYRCITLRTISKRAYHAISFEREAYLHQKEKNYIANRQRFAMWH